MDRAIDFLISALLGVLASSGFWAYVTNRRDRKSLQTQLLIGLAHDRLVTLCLHYLEVGSISQDEYENLSVYLYASYSALGGNGSVKKLMAEIDKLPTRKEKTTEKIGDQKHDSQ